MTPPRTTRAPWRGMSLRARLTLLATLAVATAWRWALGRGPLERLFASVAARASSVTTAPPGSPGAAPAGARPTARDDGAPPTGDVPS